MLNYTLIRRLHNRHPQHLPALDFIYQEVAQRMLDRLNYIKLQPQHILDIGSGLGFDASLLRKVYPTATVYQLDNALAMLHKQPQHAMGLIKRLLAKPNQLICAQADQLPLAKQSMNLVWSNLVLPYIDDFSSYFKEINRVLSLGGCCLISGLGVDSLQQLREVGLITYDFPDMHIIGDTLLKLGFSNPVTDLEYITLEYDNFNQLLADIRIIGCGAAVSHSTVARSTSFGRSDYHNLAKRFANLSHRGKIPLTLEVFYVHAWKDKITPDLAENQSIIQFYPQQTKT